MTSAKNLSADDRVPPNVARELARWAAEMDEAAIRNAQSLIAQAMTEDLAFGQDITTAALIPADARGRARFVARTDGFLCGLGVCSLVVEKYAPGVTFSATHHDGDELSSQTAFAELRGPAREILSVERTCLNFLGHLSGISSLTRKFVRAIEGTNCVVLDTRKTLPAWRLLAKYAVRCGGGRNHRLGLYDGILIKDNHLALCGSLTGEKKLRVDEAIRQAQKWRAANYKSTDVLPPIEAEVDSIALFELALRAEPDIVLLDNMNVALIRQCVTLRNQSGAKPLLEASGGVRLESVREIALCGVDRISVGALTHSAPNLDIGLDWSTDPAD